MANAAPLAEWDFPEEFHTLRRLMEARMLKVGRREYVQVLRLLETFGLNDLHGAIKDALVRQNITAAFGAYRRCRGPLGVHCVRRNDPVFDVQKRQQFRNCGDLV